MDTPSKKKGNKTLLLLQMYQRKPAGLHLNIVLWKVGRLGGKKFENYRCNSSIMPVITSTRTI